MASKVCPNLNKKTGGCKKFKVATCKPTVYRSYTTKCEFYRADKQKKLKAKKA